LVCYDQVQRLLLKGDEHMKRVFDALIELGIQKKII